MSPEILYALELSFAAAAVVVTGVVILCGICGICDPNTPPPNFPTHRHIRNHRSIYIPDSME